MNLLSKLHKNSILTGPVESYCLACGCLLLSEEAAHTHIQEPSHVDKLCALPRLADNNDCIIKSKEGYFCQYCNVILPTIKRVSLHVCESEHGDNKNLQSITRYAAGVAVILASDTLIIKERSWNGFDGSTCCVCNEDYDDEEEHKRGVTHALNLIQVKCEFGEKFVYRMVDDALFVCLICNVILPISLKPVHHTSEKHQSSYEASKIKDTAITFPAVESNQKVAPIKPKNNSATLPAKDSKPQTQGNKVQNGSASNIGDNRTQNQRNTAESATLNTGDEKSKRIKPEETSVTTRTNGEIKFTPNVQAKKTEPYFYEYLKAHNYIVFANKTHHCAICDISIRDLDVKGHIKDPHHITLLEKHVARRASNNVNTRIQGKVPYKNKEPEIPVTEVKQLEKQFNECALTDKENGVPKGDRDVNRAAKEEVSICVHARDKAGVKPQSTETTVQSKKESKKAQKKAAKNKAAEKKAAILPKEVHQAEAVHPQAGGLGASETPTEERGYLADPTPAVTDDSNIKADDSELKSEHADDLQTVEATMPVIKTEKLYDILKTVAQVDSDTTSDDIVVNNKYVLVNMSFILVMCTDTRADCVACGEELMIDHVYQHIASESHLWNVQESLVVTSMEDEFIRQVKSQEYHCGYCNMLLPNWEDMTSHLNSYQHNEAKTSASWRFVRYLPHLNSCEPKEVRSVLSTIYRYTKE